MGDRLQFPTSHPTFMKQNSPLIFMLRLATNQPAERNYMRLRSEYEESMVHLKAQRHSIRVRLALANGDCGARAVLVRTDPPLSKPRRVPISLRKPTFFLLGESAWAEYSGGLPYHASQFLVPARQIKMATVTLVDKLDKIRSPNLQSQKQVRGAQCCDFNSGYSSIANVFMRPRPLLYFPPLRLLSRNKRQRQRLLPTSQPSSPSSTSPRRTRARRRTYLRRSCTFSTLSHLSFRRLFCGRSSPRSFRC